MFQNPEQQFLTGRLRDELALGPLRSGEHAAAARATADALLERLGLTAFADANPYTLSGGQQRRLSVATALATSPRVLVLDEPTFGQDAATWRGAGHPAGRAAGPRLRRRRRHPRRGPGGRARRRPAAPCEPASLSLGPVGDVRLGRINPVAQLTAIARRHGRPARQPRRGHARGRARRRAVPAPGGRAHRPRAPSGGAPGPCWSAPPGWAWSTCCSPRTRPPARAWRSRCGSSGSPSPASCWSPSTDPVRLADALTVHWRVSTRFAYGALAALRLVPLLVTEFESVRLARRTRGVEAGRNPVAHAAAVRRHRRSRCSSARVRRGSRLATAMDARGFDSGIPRTNARGSHLHRAGRRLRRRRPGRVRRGGDAQRADRAPGPRSSGG